MSTECAELPRSPSRDANRSFPRDPKAIAQLSASLRLAASHPDGLPVFCRKAIPGVFPNTSACRLLAQRASASGWLAPTLDDPTRVKITPLGLAELMELANPRQVLEDCVRAIESRENQLTAVAGALQGLESCLASLKGT